MVNRKTEMTNAWIISRSADALQINIECSYKICAGAAGVNSIDDL